MSNFSKLFSPIKIGSMELKNRIVMAPMTIDYANPDETPSDTQIAYYAERAKGGVGLIGLEVCTVDAAHRYQQRSLGLHSDELIPGHKKLVDAIHAHGAKVQPQLSHTGPESLAPFYEGTQPVGPSVVLTQTTRQVCREITLDEINAIIEMYGDAARRAEQAGYDGIELHSAHSYMLLGSFLSPLRNLRQDEYAGHKFEGRTKLLLQVVENIRAKVSADFPITVRLSGFERESGGREINDTQRLAPMLVDAGVNCFHISGGVGDANITQLITGPEYHPGFNLAAAAAIKQVVDVPVMAVGQIMDPECAESILENESADLVVVGRALLADAALVNKAQSGRLNEINKCTLCQDCVDIMMSVGAGVKCAVNPRCARELEFPAEKTENTKKVLVIGGGPGGLAAAEAAHQRGHQVTLIEKQTELGGVFKLASTTYPHNQAFLDYLITQVKSLPVKIILGKEATEETIKEINPDAIIVATGAKIETPQFVGIDGANVISGSAVYQLIQQASQSSDPAKLPLKDTVAIIGGNLIGLELAEYLAKLGRQVHLIEPTSRLATPAGKKRRCDHAKRLDMLGVPVNTGVAIKEISNKGVQIIISNGKERLVKAGTVIVIGQPSADTAFADSLQSLAEQVYSIGDCTGFGLSKKAITEAMEVAYKI